jgi:hypothetical protein
MLPESSTAQGGGSMRLEMLRRFVPAYILLATVCLLLTA